MKAAKTANIAKYRPEAIWQPWQPWQRWQPSGHLVDWILMISSELVLLYEKWTDDAVALSDRFAP